MSCALYSILTFAALKFNKKKQFLFRSVIKFVRNLSFCKLSLKMNVNELCHCKSLSVQMTFKTDKQSLVFLFFFLNICLHCCCGCKTHTQTHLNLTFQQSVLLVFLAEYLPKFNFGKVWFQAV